MDWVKKYNIRQGTYTSNFRMFNPISVSKGDTYSDMEQSWCNLNEHESEFDIIETIKHEDFHVALKREDMNEDTEHLVMRTVTLVSNGLIILE